MCQRRQKSDDVRAPCTGELKFCGKRKPEQQREADRHVGVAGEVEVELERVAERGGPAGDELERVVLRRRAVDVRGERVGDQRAS